MNLQETFTDAHLSNVYDGGDVHHGEEASTVIGIVTPQRSD